MRSAGETLAAISGFGVAAPGFFDYHRRIAAPLDMSKQVVVDYTAELPERGTAGQLGSQRAGRRRQPGGYAAGSITP